jgi:hypothetical protein
MNSQTRTELMRAMEELGSLYPQWRMGQLIANIAGWADQEIWDVEDEQLLGAIRCHLEQRDASKASPTS